MVDSIIYRSKKTICKLWALISKLDDLLRYNKKTKIITIGITLIFFASIVFVFNYKTPLQWDDFKLSFIWTENVTVQADGGLNEPTERINSIVDILQSQYNHYYTWGGRTVVHVIAQYLLYIDPIKADILNTLVYLVYVFLIYYHIIGHKKNDPIIFIGVNIIVWLLQPVFGETILWLTGSANYLWGTSLVLAFLLPYRLFRANRSKYKIIKALLLFIFGIIAGWTNENTVAAAIIITLLYLIYYYHQKWKIPAWAISGFIGLLVGYIIMISAPGNFHRAALRTSGIPLDLFHISYRFLTSTQALFEYLGVISLLGLILLFIIRKHSTKNYSYHLFLWVTYTIGTLIAIYVMIFSPFFPPRAWFGAITFSIIAFGILYSELNLSFSFIKQIRVICFIFSIVFFGFTLYEGYRDVNEINNIWNNRKALIAQQGEKKEPIVFQYTWSKTKFALSDPPFLKNVVDLYYDTDITVK